mmetsp:Transcript_99509/g.290544  ORF Transcript_99509/g.290544 Transcript_99509/m.290544 type:complete len:225 (+) Transcript_99509:253-927(+)
MAQRSRALPSRAVWTSTSTALTSPRPSKGRPTRPRSPRASLSSEAWMARPRTSARRMPACSRACSTRSSLTGAWRVRSSCPQTPPPLTWTSCGRSWRRSMRSASSRGTTSSARASRRMRPARSSPPLGSLPTASRATERHVAPASCTRGLTMVPGWSGCSRPCRQSSTSPRRMAQSSASTSLAAWRYAPSKLTMGRSRSAWSSPARRALQRPPPTSRACRTTGS